MIRPESEKELGEIIAAGGPFRIIGGGTRPVGHDVDAEPLTTSALSGVKLYEPGALTLVCGAGTPMTEIDAVLASEGQQLAFEPMDHRGLLGTAGPPTIGGVVAANVSGPRRVRAGAARDFLLGVRFVDGMGNVVKNGGRVMKNVTGYDLVKLMAGSRGTLGVITEVSLKSLPAPEARAVLLIEGLDDATAIEALSTALGSPYEVSGAAHVPVGLDGTPVTMIRVEGFEDSVARRAGLLRTLLTPLGGLRHVELDPGMTADGWAWVGNAAPFHDTTGDVWRISAKPSLAPDLVAAAPAERVLYDWGGGLIWIETPPGADLRERLGAFDGHATLVRAAAETRARLDVFHPETPPVAKLSEGLRSKFDPRGVLNPGLTRRNPSAAPDGPRKNA